MKNLIILLITFISLQPCFSQESLSSIQKLESLSRVWGFLKYYHPEVAKGKFDWDKQLIHVLPKVEEAMNKEALSKVYLNWIDSLGRIKICRSCKNEIDEKNFNKNFDLSWSQDSSVFTNEIIEKLNFIEYNRFQGENYYVSSIKHVGNVKIVNETKYEQLEYPDINYRLLCLFKYWNIIEYFFPYKYLTDQRWDDVLTEMTSKFRNAKDATEYHLAILELVAKIDDSHVPIIYTKSLGEWFGKFGIPIKYQIINDKAIITGFYYEGIAELDDLKVGDAILEVDNITISRMLKSKQKYIPASHKSGKYKNSEFILLASNNKKASIKYERNGNVYTKEINRYNFSTLKKRINNSNNIKWEILDGNIGYVHLGNVNSADVKKMMNTLMECKAIIFDVRTYPNGTFRRISRHLNSEKKDFAKIIKPDLSYPGNFLWKKKKTTGSKNKNYYKGKVVLLVNDQTLSHAEYTVMSFQTAPNVITIGSQTAGADGDVSQFSLVGEYKTNITGTGIFYPDGTETQRKGVRIDIEVTPTIKGIREGKDEILESALIFLSN